MFSGIQIGCESECLLRCPAALGQVLAWGKSRGLEVNWSRVFGKIKRLLNKVCLILTSEDCACVLLVTISLLNIYRTFLNIYSMWSLPLHPLLRLHVICLAGVWCAISCLYRCRTGYISWSSIRAYRCCLQILVR